MNPDDPQGVGLALRSWVAKRFGVEVTLIEGPTRVVGGFDNRIYRVRFSGNLSPEYTRPLIARIQQGADRLPTAEREARLQSWCADRGYPTPRVLALISPVDDIQLPTQLMEFVPGKPMLACILRRPWRALEYVRHLADLHVRLHNLSTSSWPDTDQEGGALAERRLALVERISADLDARELAHSLERVREHLVPQLAVTDPRVCHGDFHPLNVLVDGDQSWVIDWTDAGLGDRHGDIARTALLFRVAAIAATNPVERQIFRTAGPWLASTYLRAYQRHMEIQTQRLNLWEPLHLLHGWAQVKAATTGMFDRAPEYAQSLRPELGDWFQSKFEQKMDAIGC